MYDYVITKPELEEALYHAGFHKYIDRYKGKNGKWVYVYRKAKNLYERGKRQIGLKTGKYSKYNEDYLKTLPSYLQKAIKQTGRADRVITTGSTNKKPYIHLQDKVYDNARTSHYDKNSKFERQSGYAMNNDPRYKKQKTTKKKK